MMRIRRPPSQGWKTFLRNHTSEIASLDLLYPSERYHQQQEQHHKSLPQWAGQLIPFDP
jgi:hypothetical protein